MLILALSLKIRNSVTMPKPFAAFDVDGTIFKSSLVEKAVDGCIEAGIFRPEPFNRVYESRQKWQASNNEGVYQSYIHRLVGAFVQQIAGVEVEQFEAVAADMFAHHAVRRFAFPRQVIERTRSSHYHVAISGSPLMLVKPFLADLPMQDVYGSGFEIQDGVFTGVATPVGDKEALLQELVRTGITKQEGSLAVGDTITDAPMLHYAETPMMFNASRTLTNYGRQHHWLRVHEVKDQVTYLNWNKAFGGYTECDFNTALARAS